MSAMTAKLLELCLLLGAFLGFMALGVPVFFAMGLAAMTFILAGGEVPLNLMATALVQGIDSFAFLAIPFFFLAGDLMNTGGITRRLLAFALLIAFSARYLPSLLSELRLTSRLIVDALLFSSRAICLRLSPLDLPLATQYRSQSASC